MRTFRITSLLAIGLATSIGLAAPCLDLSGSAEAAPESIALDNPGFELGAWGDWQLPPEQNQYGSPAELDASVSHDGSYAAKMYLRWGGSIIRQDMPLDVPTGSDMRLSFWFKMPHAGSTSNKWFSASLRTYNSSGDLVDLAQHFQFDAVTTWTKLELSLTTTEDIEAIRIQAHSANGNGSYRGFDRPVWVDDFSLTVEEPNEPPVAVAGDDLVLECTSALGASVALDGVGSSDPDGDELSYEWSAAGVYFDDPLSATPTGTFPPGPTLVTLTVADGNGGISVDDVLVTVVDTIPPVVLCTTDVSALWPANHKMIPVEIFLEASDFCSDDDEILVTCAVTSNEPDDGAGDGSSVGDVDGADGYSAPVSVSLAYDSSAGGYVGSISLRAERDGSQLGRTYSVACEVTDASGNSSTASCVVVVPHDKRKKK